MKDFLDKHPKLKSVYFWLGLVSIIFASAGIDFGTLTSWNLFVNALISIVQNPVAVVAVIGSVVAMWNDNSTSGLDRIKPVAINEPEDPTEKVKGIPGVCWSKSNNKYKAYIKIDNKQHHLGYYDNLEDAIQARRQAEEKLKGDE